MKLLYKIEISKKILALAMLLGLSVFGQFQISNINIENESCAAANDGIMTITVTGGTGPYDFYVFGPSNVQSLGNVSGTVTFTNLSPGVGYTVFALDGVGNFDDESATILAGLFVPAPTASSNAPLCVGQTINLNASNVAGASYSWDGPNSFTSTLQNPNIVNAQIINSGTYRVRASLLGGQSKTCFSSFSNTSVTVGTQPVASFTINKSVFCVNEAAMITFNGSAGSGATYNWNFDGATIISGAGAGPYIVRWASPGPKSVGLSISIGSCTSNNFVNNVFVNPLPTAVLSGDNTICGGGSTNLRVDFTGTSPWIFNYTDGFTTTQDTATTNPYFFSVSPNVTSNFSLSAPFRDANCQSALYSGTATVTVNSLPTATISGTATVCQGDSATLSVTFTGTAPFSFSYTDGTNTFNETSNAPFRAIRVKPGSSTTEFTLLSMNDADGCSGSVSGSAIVNVKPTPTSTFDLPTQACVGTAANITYTGDASPSATYSWNFNGPSSVLPGVGQGPHNITWNSTGVRTVTLTVTEDGCTSEPTSNSVSIVNRPQAGIFAITPSICAGLPALIRFQFSGDPVYNYSYRIANKSTSSIVNQSTSSATVNVPIVLTDTTTFTLLSISNDICSGDLSPVSTTVNVRPVPTSSFDIPTSVCQNQPVTITYTGTGIPSATYNWNFDGGTVLSGSGRGPYQVSWNSNGVRNVTLQVIQNGCTSTLTSRNISVNPLPIVNIDPISALCLNSSPVLLTASPNGGVFSGIGVSGNQFNPAFAGVGSHTVTYSFTDGNGCANSATTVASVNPLPVIVFNNPGASFCLNTPAINLVASPVGGVFSGNGVSGNVFNPANAGVGPHTLTYTFTDGNGCTNSATRNVFVNPLPVVSIDNPTTTFCVNSPTVSLIGSPAGGVFSGNGVSSNIFDPSVAGAGTHGITYTFTDANSCTNAITVNFSVNPIPVINFVNPGTVFCLNNPLVSLSATPLGGVFSGNGVSGNQFNPSLAGVGTHTVTYTFSDGNGCSNFAERIIEVFPLPVVTIDNPSASYCVNASSVNLTGNPVGGSYSGPGVIGNVFNPANAGVGSHVITYSFTDGNNCTNTATVDFTVNPLPVLTLTPIPTPICSNAGNINLSATPAGGVFSGPGVSGTVFNPAIAGAGNHLITYSFTDANNCSNAVSQSVSVNLAPTVVLNNFGTAFCIDAPPVTMTGSPVGGVFSGNGVSGNTFNPSTAGLGSHLITYSFSDANGCSNQDSRTVIVNPLPVISFSPIPSSICLADAPITLTATPLGGVFSGNGVSGNTFNPNNAGVGNHTITYTFTDANGCVNSSSQSITVVPAPTATISGNSTICIGQSSTITITLTGISPFVVVYSDGSSNFTLNTTSLVNNISVSPTSTRAYTLVSVTDNQCGTGFVNGSANITVNPLPVVNLTASQTSVCVNSPAVTLNGTPIGGIYSGVGVSGNQFDPAIAGVGTQTVTYSFTDANNCSNTATIDITVNPLPVLTITSSAGPYCVNSPAFPLTANPSGGSFSGNGVSFGNFNPSVAGVGVHTVTYVFTDANGCTNATTQDIQVLPLPIVTLSASQTSVCLNSPAVTLTGTPVGGIYSGTGVSGNQFDPSVAGVGGHTITYTFTDGSGCVNSATANITVNPLPVVNLTASQTSVCVNSPAVTLNGTPIGGIYSGVGVSGNQFDPAIAGVGTQTVTYSFTDANNCSNTATIDITVSPLPVLTITSSAGPYCVNSPAFPLTANPSGGSFSGNGVSFGNFNPSVAGVGVHTVTYVFTDANNCTNATTQDIQVLPLPIVTLSASQTSVCLNSPAVTLTGTPVGGVYSGTGVSGNQFDPSVAGVGGHTITYVFTDANNCTNATTQDIQVLPLPIVTLSASQTSVCLNSPAVTLTGTPVGGVYSGTGVSGNQFDPSVAGVGGHTITYTFTDGSGCVNSATVNITVNPLPVVVFDFIPTGICFNEPSVTLLATPVGGVFSGNGMIGNQFSPSVAGVGLHTITYTFTDANGCVNSVSENIEVFPNPSATISGDNSICAGQTSTLTFTLVGSPEWVIQYTDGTNLFSDTVFNSPYTVSVNPSTNTTYTLVSVNDQQCGSGNVSGSATLVVNSLPNVNLVQIGPFCLNNPVVALSASPVGGVFSGNGVVGSDFDPALAGVGNHLVVYSFTDGNNCSNADSIFVSVTDIPTADFDIIGEACVGEDVSINYLGNATTNATYNWQFDGGVQIGGSNQNPVVRWSNDGNITVRLIVDENGCSSNEESNLITINPLPTAIISGDQDICEGQSANLNLTFSGSLPFSFVYTDGVNQFNGTSNSNNFSQQVSPGDTSTYTLVSVSDLYCASNQVSGSATVNVIPTLVNTFTIGGAICQGDTVVVNYSGIESLTATYIWSFDNPDFQSGSGAGPYQLLWNALGQKSISLQVIDKGCSSTVNTQIADLGNTPTAEISGDTTICLLQNSIIKFQFTGVAPFSYTYTDGVSVFTGVSNAASDSASFLPSADGNYVFNLVSVTDGNGCSAVLSGSANVLVRAIPTAAISGGGIVCEGSSDTLTINFGGNATIWDYAYTDGTNLFTGSTSTSPVKIVITPTADVVYNLVNVNNGTCDGSVTGSASFDFVPTPTSTFDVVSEVCLNQTTVVTYTGNGSPFAIYTWDFDGGIATGVQQGPYDVSWNSTGTKTITLTVSENGCLSAQTSRIVLVNTLPTAAISGDTNICSGNPANLKINLTGNGVWTVVYFDGLNEDTVSLSNENSFVSVTPLDTTTYTLISVVDSKGCLGSVSGSATIIVRPTPTAEFVFNNPVCEGDIVDLKYSGNASSLASLTWDFDGANVLSNLNDREFNLEWSGSGTKSISLEIEENFCSSTDTRLLVINPLPTASLLSGAEICVGDSAYLPISMTGTKPFFVSYEVNGVFQSTVQFNQADDTLKIFVGSNSQVKLTSVIDSNGCFNNSNSEVSVIVNPLPQVALIFGDTICSGQNASITYSIIGSFAPWQVMLSDSNFYVANANNGVLSVPVADTSYFKALNIRDNKGCFNLGSLNDSVLVVVKPTPTSDFDVAGNVCLETSSTVSYTGTGTSNAQFDWNFGTFDASPGVGIGPHTVSSENAGSTTISLKVTEFGCESSETSRNVQILNLPNAQFVNNPEICFGESASLNITFTGVAPFSYTYIDGANSFSDTSNTLSKTVVVSPTTTLSYILTEISDAACSNVIGNFATVIVNQLPEILVNNLSTGYCLTQPAVLLTASVPGTFTSNITNGFTNLGGGQALLDPGVVGLGDYQITVSYTDTKGCSNSITQDFNIFDKPYADFSFDSLYCANIDTVLITQPTGSIFGTFSIVPQGGLAYDTLTGSIIPNLSSAGVYVITNTVAVGACPAESFRDTVVIRPQIPKPFLDNWIDTVICPNFVDSIGYSISNQVAGVSYLWIVSGGSIVNDSIGTGVRVKWQVEPSPKSLTIVATDDFCSADTTYKITTSFTTVNILSVSDSIENDQFIRVRYLAVSSEPTDSVMIFRRVALPIGQQTDWALVKKKEMDLGVQVFTDGPLNTDRFSYEYRLGAVNRCGDTTFSIPHQTVVAAAVGDEKEETVTLDFNVYKGWFANVYEVYRQMDNDPEYKLFTRANALNDTSLLFRNVSSDGFNQCYRVLAKIVVTDTATGKEIVVDSSWSNITCVRFKNPIKVFNSFSPNGDGVNEFFWVNNINLYPDNEVFVFNRWGARVFHRNGYNNNWDGGGLPDGTYFYTIRVEGDEYRGYVYIGR